MLLETPLQTSDFTLLDTGHGYRLEQWGPYILKRPDPQIIWQNSLPDSTWQRAGAVFEPAKDEVKGRWILKQKLPEQWAIQITGLRFYIKLSPFKHTGVFPEQAAQWEWLRQRLKSTPGKPKILNLFAYTGGASLALAKLGAFVTHVDASKPSLAWAKDNQVLNQLPENSIRWILDDAVKFVRREIKRGAFYDGIIMDPPAFGHGASGRTWKFNRDLPSLLHDCVQLLSKPAKFLLVNGYATNSSALALNNLLEDALAGRPNKLEFGELCLKQKTGRLISTGIFARAEL